MKNGGSKQTRKQTKQRQTTNGHQWWWKLSTERTMVGTNRPNQPPYKCARVGMHLPVVGRTKFTFCAFAVRFAYPSLPPPVAATTSSDRACGTRTRPYFTRLLHTHTRTGNMRCPSPMLRASPSFSPSPCPPALVGKRSATR